MNPTELSHVLTEHAERARVPGASVAVLTDGRIVAASAGIADVSTGQPADDATAFPIASVTKPMVATVLAHLAGDGMLDLDDPIARHAPELRSAPWAERVTLAHLLSQCSGIRLRAATEFAFDDRDVDALARFCAAVAGEDLIGEPGTTWCYGNTGYSMLGRAIETATKLPWPEAMRTRLFEPIGMDRTGPRSTLDNVVVGHDEQDGRPVPVEPWFSPALGPGGALLWSTATDLIRFAQPHVNGDALARLREPVASPHIWPWMDQWCHGWARLDWTGGPVWGWDGVTRGARAQLRIIPGKRGAIALLCNSARGRALYWSLMPALMHEYFGITQPPQMGSAQSHGGWDGYTGTYAWPDVELRVEAGADQLIVRQGDTALAARPSGERTFTIDMPSPDPVTITFAEPAADGSVPMMYWVVWGYPRARD